MKNLATDLYNKIQKLSHNVRQDLQKKGIVIPSKNRDGSISVGYFTIVKTQAGYAILDPLQDPVVDHINLPQTAIIVANGLALGKYKDDAIINSDRQYGYALFDEELHLRAIATSKKKTLEHYELMTTKAEIAKSKKEFYKKTLLNRYAKLIQLV